MLRVDAKVVRFFLALLLMTSVLPAEAQNFDAAGVFGGIIQGAIRAQQQEQIQQRRQQYPQNPQYQAPVDERAPYEQRDDDPLHPRNHPVAPAVTAASGPSAFIVDGFALGAVADPASLPGGFKCQPSEEFEGFLWCRRVQHDAKYLKASSILMSREGRVSYINKFVSPAVFGPGEITQEVNRLTTKFKTPPHVVTLPQRPGTPNGVIVTWGEITLTPYGNDVLKQIADGHSAKLGILVDFLGDIKASAQQGLPVYRIGGGPGFLWSASYDQSMRGTLRFGAADASSYNPRTEPGTATMAGAAPFDASEVVGIAPAASSTNAAPSSNLASSGSPQAGPPPGRSVTQTSVAPLVPEPQASQGLTMVGGSTKTVVVDGVGVDVNEAAKNAAQNALTQVVGSFIDTNTLLAKHTQIVDGIRGETKDITSTVREYSQGAIQSITLGNATTESGLTRVSATVTVRVEDFKAYMTKAASGEVEMGAGLFAQISSAKENQKNLDSILNEKIIHPIMLGEATDITVAQPVPFSQAGINTRLPANWNIASTVLFPVTISLRSDFLANLGRTLDSISSGYQRLPYSASDGLDCRNVLKPFDERSDLGLSIVNDLKMFNRDQNFNGRAVSYYKLSGLSRVNVNVNTKIDIQILDKNGRTLFESLRAGANDMDSTSIILYSTSPLMPWRLVSQDGSCVRMAVSSSFSVLMQIDETTLKNAAKVSVSLR